MSYRAAPPGLLGAGRRTDNPVKDYLRISLADQYCFNRKRSNEDDSMACNKRPRTVDPPAPTPHTKPTFRPAQPWREGVVLPDSSEAGENITVAYHSPGEFRVAREVHFPSQPVVSRRAKRSVRRNAICDPHATYVPPSADNNAAYVARQSSAYSDEADDESARSSPLSISEPKAVSEKSSVPPEDELDDLLVEDHEMSSLTLEQSSIATEDSDEENDSVTDEGSVESEDSVKHEDFIKGEEFVKEESDSNTSRFGEAEDATSDMGLFVNADGPSSFGLPGASTIEVADDGFEDIDMYDRQDSAPDTQPFTDAATGGCQIDAEPKFAFPADTPAYAFVQEQQLNDFKDCQRAILEDMLGRYAEIICKLSAQEQQMLKVAKEQQKSIDALRADLRILNEALAQGRPVYGVEPEDDEVRPLRSISATVRMPQGWARNQPVS